MKLALIAANTFRETVRDKVLYNLILFVILLTAASILIGELSISQESKIILDMGLSSMLLFGALIAIFIGTGLVYKEIEKRTIYSLLSKPIQRSDLILGKFMGLGATLFVNSAVMCLGVVAALLYLERGFSRELAACSVAALMIFLELLIITSVALLFSTFSSPTLSALLSFLLFIAGNYSTDFLNGAQSSQSMVTKSILCTLYYLLPNFSNFNFITKAAHGWIVPAHDVFYGLLYAVLYCGVLVAASVVIFERRDLK